jgi:hypothetical protein
MAKLGINTGSAPNDGTGDSLSAGAIKINANFDELYSSIGDGTNLSIGTGTTSTISLVYPNVGIGSTIPAHKLDVNGNLGSNGIVVSGIGTISTAEITTLNGVSSLDSTTVATIETAIAALPNDFTYINVTGLATIANLSTSGVGTIATLNSTTVNVGSAVTISGAGINVAGVSTLAGSVSANSIVVDSTQTIDSQGIRVSGIVTATSFVGEGSGIYGLNISEFDLGMFGM